MQILARVFGGVALLLLTLLAIGIVLPKTWTASATGNLEVEPDSVYSVVEEVGAWHRWMPWPDTGTRLTGPASGTGASFAWDDPVYGRGTFRIVDARPPRLVEYRVSVEEGAISVRGTLELRGVDGGTEVRWTEEARVGWNPLLGFAALSQENRQSEQLRGALERLRAYLGSGAEPDGSSGAQGRGLVPHP